MTHKIVEFGGDYQFLSNFEPCRVTYDGEIYSTVEHAYQAAKTLDTQQREVIRDCETASKAKRFGQRVLMRDDWEKIKLGVMKELLEQKFSKEPYKSKLLGTGTMDIEEGNWWGDTFWGVCEGKGDNHLGKMLMQIREELS